MQNKKIGVYSLVAVLLVAGSNLHGSGGLASRVLKYVKDNKTEVVFNAATMFNFATTIAGVCTGYTTNQEVNALKERMNKLKGFQVAEKLNERLEGIEAQLEERALSEKILVERFTEMVKGAVRKVFAVSLDRQIAAIKNITLRALQTGAKKHEEVDQMLADIKDVTIKKLQTDWAKLKDEWEEQQKKVNASLAGKADQKDLVKLQTEFDGFVKERRALKLVTQASLKALVRKECAALAARQGGGG